MASKAKSKKYPTLVFATVAVLGMAGIILADYSNQPHVFVNGLGYGIIICLAVIGVAEWLAG